MKQFKKDVITVLILIGLTLLCLEFVNWVCRMAFENTCIELEEQYLSAEIGEIAESIENSIDFGKSLDNYYGMDEVLAQAVSLSEGELKAVILDTDGRVLYASFTEQAQENIDDLAGLYAQDYQEKLNTAQAGDKVTAGGKTSMVFPVYEHQKERVGYLAVLYETDSLIQDEDRVNTQTALFMILEAVSVLLMLFLTSYSVHKDRKKAQYLPSVMILGGILAYIIFLFFAFRSSYHTLVEQKAVQAAASVQNTVEGLLEKGLDAEQLYRIDDYISQREQASEPIEKITLKTGNAAREAEYADDSLLAFSVASGRVRMEVELNQSYIRDKIQMMLLTFGVIFAVCLMITYELTSLAGILSVRISEEFEKHCEEQKAGISSQIRVMSFLAYTAVYAVMPYAAVIMRSWDASVFSLPASVSASLPMTVELLCVLAVSAVIQNLYKAMRLKRLMFFIFPYLILGNFACTAVSSPYLLIGLRAFCGVGEAFLKYWLNGIVAAGSENEESFSLNCGRMNAGLLGGITAGASLGAVFAQAMGYQFNYLFTAAVFLFLAVWALFTMPWKLLEQLRGREGAASGAQQPGSLAVIFENPKILLTLLFGCVPLNIGLMYMVSFIPSYMASIGQSAVAVSCVYLVNGLAGMYLGVFVLNALKGKSLFASASAALFLAAAGMLCLLISKNIGIILLSAGILGLFDGFGTPSITSYFTGLGPRHSDTAGMLTLFNVAGSAVQIVCPMLYGMLIQTDGKVTYLAVFGAAYLFLAVLFTLACRPEKKQAAPL